MECAASMLRKLPCATWSEIKSKWIFPSALFIPCELRV